MHYHKPLTKLLCCSLLLYFHLSPSYSYAKTLEKAKYYQQTVTVKGKQRQYYIYLPKGIDLKKKYPTVITFHGFESDASGIKWLIQPEKKANNYKYILIFPNALNKSWNVGKGLGSKNKNADDKAFLSTLLDVLPARHPINKKKIYAMGFSNGAQMAALAYCNFGKRVAAVGIVAHSMNIKNCQPKYKTPVAVFQGTADKYVPYSGGGKYQIKSFKDSIDFFVKANNVESIVDKVVNLKTVGRQRYQNVNKSSKVIGCTLKGNGHSWPGARKFKPEVFGVANKEINATDFLFSFFKQYSTPGIKKSADEISRTSQYLAGSSVKIKQKTSNTKTTHKTKEAKIVFEKRTYTKGKNKNIFYITKPTKISTKQGSLVIVFNGKGFTARNMHNIIGGNDFINSYNFIYVYPQWSPNNGSIANQFDELFIHQLKEQLPQYAHRIFVLGYSDGGTAAQDYFCDYSYALTAVATANYAWRNRDCSPATSRPILVLQSKKDTKQPYKGNLKKNQQSFRNTITKLTANLNPMIVRNDYIKGKDHRCGAWKDEMEKLTIVECSTDWGGHNLAGSKFSFEKSLGPHMKHFKAPKVISGFFNKQKHENFFTFHQR